jgi:hypothetical protein
VRECSNVALILSPFGAGFVLSEEENVIFAVGSFIDHRQSSGGRWPPDDADE